MKKLLIILALTGFCFSSCKTNKGHCDAYGNKSGKVQKKKNHV